VSFHYSNSKITSQPNAKSDYSTQKQRSQHFILLYFTFSAFKTGGFVRRGIAKTGRKKTFNETEVRGLEQSKAKSCKSQFYVSGVIKNKIVLTCCG